MTIAEQIARAKNDYDEVYIAGKQPVIEVFWEILQDGGKRTDYQYGFASRYWTTDIFYPKYSMYPTNADYMFFYFINGVDGYFNLKKFFEERNLVLDFSNCKSADYVFYNSKINILPTIDFSKLSHLNHCFQNSPIKEIDLILNSKGDQYFDNVFSGCWRLESLKIRGVIGKSGINLKDARNLTHESLLNAIDCLKDYSTSVSGKIWNLTLGTENLVKLTNKEKAIATAKGWTLT